MSKLIPNKPPKSVKLSYTVTTLEPDSTEYTTFTESFNLREAKRLYREAVATQNSNTLVSLVLSVVKIYKNDTKVISSVIANSTGKVKC